MAFSLDQFYRLNRRVLIWIILFALLWLLRDFFSLIFLTFALAFLASPLIRYSQIWLRMGRRTSIVIVYLLFLGLLIGFVRFVTPALAFEAKALLRDITRIEQRVVEIKTRVLRDTPTLNNALASYLRSGLIEESARNPRLLALDSELNAIAVRIQTDDLDPHVLEPTTSTLTRISSTPARDNSDTTETLTPAERNRLHQRHAQLKQEQGDLIVAMALEKQARNLGTKLPAAVQGMFSVIFTLGLALLFSFLISMDFSRLGLQVRSLSDSHLRDFYQQTAQPVVRFAYVVGRALQAQALIAVANTLLTVVGLLLLGIPSVALLAVIVFVCSFIPVLGVFISTTPIVLFAINAGGFKLALGAVIMVMIIHAIEAYLLNPLIYGRHLKINPVIVLIILFIGHHAFGVWGMILGVPVAHYFIHDVFGVPIWDERRLAAAPRPLSAQTATPEQLERQKRDEGAARPE